MAADESAKNPEPQDLGTCPEKIHVFVWDSGHLPTCPLTQVCLCGKRRYADALIEAVAR